MTALNVVNSIVIGDSVYSNVEVVNKSFDNNSGFVSQIRQVLVPLSDWGTKLSIVWSHGTYSDNYSWSDKFQENPRTVEIAFLNPAGDLMKIKDYHDDVVAYVAVENLPAVIEAARKALAGGWMQIPREVADLAVAGR